MTVLLAIDATDQACSVALSMLDVADQNHGERKTLEKFTSEPRQHATRILPMIRQLLAENGLTKSAVDAIAVGIGPGSFTGLRIALSIAQSLAYALSKPVYPISSLLGLAMQHRTMQLSPSKSTSIFVGLDARMGEVYCAGFMLDQEGELSRDTEDLLLSQEDAAVMAQDYLLGLGSAVSLTCFSEVKFSETNPEAQVHAADISELAMNDVINRFGVSALTLEPAYLRRENAWKKLDKQGVS